MSERWLFVVGCTNSGTSLVKRYLSSHRDVAWLAREGQFHTEELPREHRLGLDRCWALASHLFRMTENDSRTTAQRVRRDWLKVAQPRNKPVVVEKTPYNLLRMRWLERWFPDARFVCVVRNGLAVAEGLMRWAGKPCCTHKFPAALAAFQWQAAARVWRDDSQHLKQALTLRYEDLVASPKTELAGLLEFCGLSRAGGARLVKPIDPDRNRRAIERLEKGDRATIERVAQHELRMLNYL